MKRMKISNDLEKIKKKVLITTMRPVSENRLNIY